MLYHIDCNIHVSTKFVKNSYDAAFLKLLPELNEIKENNPSSIFKRWITNTKITFNRIFRIFFSK